MPESERSRRQATRWEFVLAMAIASCIFAVFAPAKPTGITAFDVIECALFAGIVTLFAASSRRWAWLVLAGTATVFAGSIWGHLLGAVALGFAMNAALRTTRRDRVTGALIGALSIQVLLRTADIGFFGTTAIITGLAVSTVIFSGYRTMRARNKRRVQLVTSATLIILILASAGFVITALRATPPVQDAIRYSQQGLDYASQAQQNDAANSWLASHRYFNEANAILSTPFSKVAYAIPVLSQQAQIINTAAGAGSQITEIAAHAANVAPYRTLRAADGTFDLAAISSMEEPVAQTKSSMIHSRERLDAKDSPWLLKSLKVKVTTFRDKLAHAIPEAANALQAIQAAPEILGGNGARRYLILFANPAEARGMGGFIGAWAELDATNGKLTLGRHGKMDSLDSATDPSSRHITGEAEFMRRYGHLQPARYIQNISASPDFPTVARVAEQLYPQAGGSKIDGVMYIDPFALAAILKLTGPVTAQGIPMPLTSDNAAQFLMHDQYVIYPGTNDRSDLLSNAAEATFHALTTRKLPSILDVSKTLAPMVHDRRLLADVTDKQANAYLSSIKLTGEFPRANSNDFVSVRTSNGSENKVDYFLNRVTFYKATIDPKTGRTSGKLIVVLSNTAPSSGLPTYVLGNPDTRAGRTDGRPFASNTVQFSIYTNLIPTSMRINGKSVGIGVEREFGHWVSTQTVTIPSGGSARIELDTDGTLPTSGAYRLTVVPQASANPGTSLIGVAATSGGHSAKSHAVTQRTLGGAAIEQLFTSLAP